MKHRLPTFLAGMATTLLISGLTITALAAAETITFTTTVNSVNIEVNGVRVAAMGEDYRLEDNTMTPNSISYNNTTYVPIRRFER